MHGLGDSIFNFLLYSVRSAYLLLAVCTFALSEIMCLSEWSSPHLPRKAKKEPILCVGSSAICARGGTYPFLPPFVLALRYFFFDSGGGVRGAICGKVPWEEPNIPFLSFLFPTPSFFLSPSPHHHHPHLTLLFPSLPLILCAVGEIKRAVVK